MSDASASSDLREVSGPQTRDSFKWLQLQRQLENKTSDTSESGDLDEVSIAQQTQLREPIAWCCCNLLTTTEVQMVGLGVIADLVCFYFTFAPSIIERRNGEKITHYWAYHASFAFWLFFNAWGAYFFVIQKFQLVHPGPFCALLCAAPFYISREFRDLEKLGFVDIPGLVAPTVGLILLWIIAEGLTRYYSRRPQERYARTTTAFNL